MKNSSSIVSRSFLAIAFVTLFAAGAGGCALSVEADVPDVEVTQHGIAVVGVPTAISGGNDMSTNLSFTQSLPDLNLPADLGSTVKAVKVDLVAKSGVDNFDFLKSLRITMTPAGSTVPTELINYQKADGATVGNKLSIDSLNPVNILDQWKANKAVFNIEVEGKLPSQTWTMDMSVHFAGQVSYKY
ncbi:MAG TPA: hypothetical protein VGP07_02865 [Polyangia bacterium]|jgi:hypothetical protein